MIRSIKYISCEMKSFISCIVYIRFVSFVGTQTFAPSFAQSNKYITADLFQKVKLECRPLADPYVVYKWTKTNPYQIGSKSIETNVIKKSEYSTLTFPNITWGERGRYYCNVWNSQGDAKVAYDIKVNRKFFTILFLLLFSMKHFQ